MKRQKKKVSKLTTNKMRSGKRIERKKNMLQKTQSGAKRKERKCKKIVKT